MDLENVIWFFLRFVLFLTPLCVSFCVFYYLIAHDELTPYVEDDEEQQQQQQQRRLQRR